MQKNLVLSILINLHDLLNDIQFFLNANKFFLQLLKRIFIILKNFYFISIVLKKSLKKLICIFEIYII